MTNSLQAVLATIATVLVITTVAVGVDPLFLQCQECHVCLHVRPVSLFAVTMPFFLALALTLLVSARLMLEVHRIATPSPPLLLVQLAPTPTPPPLLQLSASVSPTSRLPFQLHLAENTLTPPQPLSIASPPGQSTLGPRSQTVIVTHMSQVH